MAAANSIPSGHEAERAELDAVLQSSAFARAPKLAQLLAYLCEKLFAGEDNTIKEYTVGIDVFHRGPSFDQNSDSIVRVQANRLRKRLREYYAAEGASHPLEIIIPVGQYVPQFAFAMTRSSGQQLARGPTPVGSRSSDWGVVTRREEKSYRRPARGAWWAGAAFALLLMGPGLALLSIHHHRVPLPVTPADAPAFQRAETQLATPSGTEVRILAGATRSFVDHGGKLWGADAFFQGGTAVKVSIAHIWRTQDQDFYRSRRQGNFRYRIPLKPGVYELRLHFAETVFGPESSGASGEGNRLMTVRANGRTLLDHFDIVADAGASRTADVKVFPGIEPAPDGYLDLQFSGDDGSQAILSAIEILPGFRGSIRPVRLLASQTPYYSNDSHLWSPDNYFEGGRMAVYNTPVSGTDDPELYQAERWGNFSYAIPVSPGRYAVTLLFAARHEDSTQSPSPSGDRRAASSRIFDVYCNGTVLLKDFNPDREAGRSGVVIRHLTGLEPNAQGKLFLSFVPVEGYAAVTGIEVVPQ